MKGIIDHLIKLVDAPHVPVIYVLSYEFGPLHPDFLVGVPVSSLPTPSVNERLSARVKPRAYERD